MQKQNTIHKKIYWITNTLKKIKAYNEKHRWLIYAIIGALATFMILGPFSDVSIVSYLKARSKRNKLKEELLTLQNKYKADSIKLYEIQNSTNALEHIAREKYYMKSPSETIFIIRNDKDEK